VFTYVVETMITAGGLRCVQSGVTKLN